MRQLSYQCLLYIYQELLVQLLIERELLELLLVCCVASDTMYVGGRLMCSRMDMRVPRHVQHWHVSMSACFLQYHMFCYHVSSCNQVLHLANAVPSASSSTRHML